MQPAGHPAPHDSSSVMGKTGADIGRIDGFMAAAGTDQKRDFAVLDPCAHEELRIFRQMPVHARDFY